MERDEPRVSDSIASLVDGARSRIRVTRDDGKSGSTFELVELDGCRYFLKTSSAATDWVARVTDDRDCWTAKAWAAGLLDLLPACIDHALVAVALARDRDGTPVLGQLMRDVGAHLVPEGDAVLPLELHERFLAHMAELHASFWGWNDRIGLMPLQRRPVIFSPKVIAAELTAPEVPVPITVADEGWRRLPERAPELAELVSRIHDTPTPLTDELSRTPATLLHGDWKLGNLGGHPDGRTILLDWSVPGAGPGCYDLAWYLALNADRLPHPKEDAVACYREALEGHGVDTAGWWDHQLDLSMVAIMATFAWEKAVGDEDELRWWEQRALRGARRLSSS